MKRLLTIVCVLGLLIAGNWAPLLFGQSNPVVQWQSMLSTINAIQLQLASLQTQINNIHGGGSVTAVSGQNGIVVTNPTTTPTVALPACTPLQFMLENTGATSQICVTMNGDVTISSATGTTVVGSYNGGTAFGPITPLSIGANLASSGGNLNTSGVPSGVINVKDATYGATGNGSTDDEPAFATAIAAACALSPIPDLYVPTPSSCYMLHSPILLNCSTGLVGPPQLRGASAKFCQNYSGPTIIAEQSSGGFPPLASSITATWQASHAYSQFAELIDSNGNLEVATVAGTSGTPTHPTWPVAQGNTVVDGGTLTWQLVTVNGTQLLTGTGSMLDSVYSRSSTGNKTEATIEVANASDIERFLAGSTNWSIEQCVNIIQACGGNKCYLFGEEAAEPQPNNIPGLQVFLNPSGGSCTNTNPCWQADADIGGAQKTITTTTPVTLGTTQCYQLTENGTTMTLGLNGSSIGTVSASGNLTIPNYEGLMLADMVPNTYPSFSSQANSPYAYYDSTRISNSTRALANTTAKYASDANTIWLENFPSTAPLGTLQAVNGAAGANDNAYIPIEVYNSQDFTPYIANLLLSDNGIWADGVIESKMENIYNFSGSRTCLFLNNNNFVDTFNDFVCNNQTSRTTTAVAYILGGGSNNNIYNGLRADGQASCILAYSGSGKFDTPYCGGDGGFVIMPFAFKDMQAILLNPDADIEQSQAKWEAAAYTSNAYAPIVIHGGQLCAGSTSGSYLEYRNNAPFNVNATDFNCGNATPATLLTVDATGGTIAAPSVVSNSYIPAGVSSLTTSTKSWWLLLKQQGQDVGMVFADLPSCTSSLNGTSRFLTDGTPGGTCSGSGGGAQALCTGTTWGCGASTLAGSVALTTGGIYSATGGTKPTATCSGGSTGVSIATGSTNGRGQIVTSSSASTNCTITWSAASTWPQAPFCVVDDAAASVTPTLVSVGVVGTSTFVIDFASATSKTFNWLCQ